jgi:hypothetical protein
MITPLSAPLKRAVSVKGQDYTIIVSPVGVKLTPKGKRKGVEFTWEQLLGGDDALVTAINASLAL